jgi:hypothetical protein
VEQVKALLGTSTLTETVDAALGEVIRLHQRRRLVEMLFTPGVLELDDSDVMQSAWRRSPSWSSSIPSGRWPSPTSSGGWRWCWRSPVTSPSASG